jgi:hypothetical protein
VKGSSEATNLRFERSAPFAIPEIFPKSRDRNPTILSLSPYARERRTIAGEECETVVRMEISPATGLANDPNVITLRKNAGGGQARLKVPHGEGARQNGRL